MPGGCNFHNLMCYSKIDFLSLEEYFLLHLLFMECIMASLGMTGRSVLLLMQFGASTQSVSVNGAQALVTSVSWLRCCESSSLLPGQCPAKNSELHVSRILQLAT